MTEDVRPLALAGKVGFDSLPYQLVNKALQKGFVFNILCIGETGIGKSTLMCSLFNIDFETTPSPHDLPSVSLKSQVYELEDSGVKLKLTIVDTVGYGDQINKEDSFKAIGDYIDQQYEAYLKEELDIGRCLQLYNDTRIHVCLYFICPGHGLKPIDLLCMKELGSKVNIIPIIAKADSVSKNELVKLKESILSMLNAEEIKIYQFPTDDESVAEVNASMNSQIPFAVVGSTEFVGLGIKMVRARQYTWGTVQVENDTHCDFVKLREMLLRTNMEDMREITNVVHYELYRKTRLEGMGFDDVDSDNEPMSFQQRYNKQMYLHGQELIKKEKEIKQQFLQRVAENDAELEEKERELNANFSKIQNSVVEERKKLEDNQKLLDDEITKFEHLKLQRQLDEFTGSRTLSRGTLKKK